MRTPGPWKKSEAENCRVIIEAPPYKDGNIVAYVFTTMHSGENRQANADFIVRACNSHDELLEACNIAIHTIRSIDHNTPEQMKDPKFWIDMRARLYAIEEAAKKAERSQS